VHIEIPIGPSHGRADGAGGKIPACRGCCSVAVLFGG
jgi:hypothetical protein